VYRSEHERETIVRRRADPWWRRILRGVVLLVILGTLAVAGYFAIDAAIDYVNRDRLPSPGVDSADVESASYRVQLDASGLAGDVTVDHASGAYRFVGAEGTDLAGIEVVGNGTGQQAVRRAGGEWQPGWSDPRAGALAELTVYLAVIDTDDVLTTTWRDGYVGIVDREQDVAVAGVEDTTMYRMEFETARYATEHPFQWNEWVATVAPLPEAPGTTLLTVWVDDDGVIRRLESAAGGIQWERVAYSGDTVPIEFPVAS
jgi:hypothetical protein